MCKDCRPLGANEAQYGHDPDAYRAERREYMQARNRVSQHEEITYVAHSPGLGLYKIGHTTNIKPRLSVLVSGCPDLKLLTTFPHGRELEHYLSDVFAHVRLKRSEWYKIPHFSSIQKAVSDFEKKGALDVS